MNRHRKILALCVSLAAALLLVSCSTTQSAGKQIDDTTIHAAVTAKLTADRFSNIVNIDINVTNGVVTLAGEVPSCWTRRAKVPLAGITDALIATGEILEARFAGTARDGGPACATVPLLDGGWHAVRPAGKPKARRGP